jgi:hypothetical protein
MATKKRSSDGDDDNKSRKANDHAIALIPSAIFYNVTENDGWNPIVVPLTAFTEEELDELRELSRTNSEGDQWSSRHLRKYGDRLGINLLPSDGPFDLEQQKIDRDIAYIDGISILAENWGGDDDDDEDQDEDQDEE